MSEKLYAIKFSAPLMPPSVNSLYNVFRYGQKIEVKLKPEVLFFKSKLKSYVPAWTFQHSGEIIYFSMKLHDPDYFFKNGKVRKKDLPNMVKAAIDAVCEKIGVDDSYVKDFRLSHVFSQRANMECEVGIIKEGGLYELGQQVSI